MLTVTLYTRNGCKLCQQVERDLDDLQEQFPHRLVLIDVEEEHITEHFDKIPVLEIGPYRIEAPIKKNNLKVTLGAARDRIDQLEKINQEAHQKRVKRGKKVSVGDKIFHWLSRRYMIVFNGFVALYIGLAVLAPALQAGEHPGAAKVIYVIYGKMCHQLSYRSWFLFGEQAAYPRKIAGLDNINTYEEATGFDPYDIDRAFRFVGNELMGYKVALCQRDIAIYGGILVFGLLFSFTGKRIPSLPIWAWFLLGIVPIGLDGLSQVLSQLPWDIIPIRESTPLLRTITGGLFGFTTAWFGYPIVEESMADTRKIMAVKIRASEAN
jgi:uncharacterized membrane protein